jgi:hypothetical protein
MGRVRRHEPLAGADPDSCFLAPGHRRVARPVSGVVQVKKAVTRRGERPAPRTGAAAAGPASPVAGRAPLLPRAGELLDPRGPFLLPLILLLVTRCVLWAFLPLASEDAYITFRYARNLAFGNGLIYNPGERVMGFSSPLWTLWSAVGFRLGAPPVPWVRSTALLADIVTLLGMGALLRRHVSRTAAWCFALFFAGWPYFAAVTLSGMENGAMLALLVLGAALVEGRNPAAGPVLGALGLLRPEGLAAAAVLAAGARWRDRLVALGLALAGWGALALYFGSPIPQSVVAKSALYGTPGPWAGRFWWEWLVPFPMGGSPRLIEGQHLFLLSVVLAPAAVVGAAALWRLRRTGLTLAVGAALAVWSGYALLGVAYFFWYLAVPLAGVAALAAAGLPRIVRGPALLVSAGLTVVGIWTIAPALYIGRAQNEFYGFARTANFLRGVARPGEKVMLEPIGIVGYQNPLVVVDEVGLVSPRVTARRLEGPGWYADVAAAERPDWLVVRRGMIASGDAFAGRGAPFRNAAERDSLLARYTLATVIDEPSGPMALAVYRRAH